MIEERMLRLTYEQENLCLSERHGFSKVMKERGLLAFNDFEPAPRKREDIIADWGKVMHCAAPDYDDLGDHDQIAARSEAFTMLREYPWLNDVDVGVCAECGCGMDMERGNCPKCGLLQFMHPCHFIKDVK